MHDLIPFLNHPHGSFKQAASPLRLFQAADAVLIAYVDTRPSCRAVDASRGSLDCFVNPKSFVHLIKPLNNSHGSYFRRLPAYSRRFAKAASPTNDLETE